MFKNAHQLVEFDTIDSKINELKTNKFEEVFLLDTFFIDGEFDMLTEVTVKYNEIVNIKKIAPSMDYHEMLIRERQMLSELNPEILDFLSKEDQNKLEHGEAFALPF